MMVTSKLRWPVLCRPKRSLTGNASFAISSHEGPSPRKKQGGAPIAKGASAKEVGSRDSQSLSTRSCKVSGSSSKVKGVPYLNSDPYCQFIGPKNWSEALIDEELTTCLLDNGSQLNFITPVYVRKRGMNVMSLDRLAQEVG